MRVTTNEGLIKTNIVNEGPIGDWRNRRQGQKTLKEKLKEISREFSIHMGRNRKNYNTVDYATIKSFFGPTDRNALPDEILNISTVFNTPTLPLTTLVSTNAIDGTARTMDGKRAVDEILQLAASKIISMSSTAPGGAPSRSTRTSSTPLTDFAMSKDVIRALDKNVPADRAKLIQLRDLAIRQLT